MPAPEAAEPPALPDHYGALGVAPDAAPEAIKAAFRRRAIASHPDKPGGSDEAFRQVPRTWLFSTSCRFLFVFRLRLCTLLLY